MKYFLLSSFASAFLLYGMALTYGSTGQTAPRRHPRLPRRRIPSRLTSGFGPMLLVALALLAVGFCFKVSAIPFQAWTPGRLRRRADVRDRVHVGRHQGGGLRRDGSRLPLRAAARAGRVAADPLGGRRADA